MVTKFNKKFISQRTPSAATTATVQVSHVRVLLNRVLQQLCIGRSTKGDNHLLPWPPCSPDLTPCDFFLWAFVKDGIYVPPLPMSLKELCDRITHALQTITADMLHRVWDEFDYRLDVSYDPECTHWRIMIHEWGIWTIAASGVVRCARVRWEINYMLTFETAPFFCVHPVYILFISRAFVDNVGVLWNSFC